MTEMEEQRKKAVEMGGHLKDLAATYDLDDDKERHLLKCLAQAYVNEQTRYEYMKLQAGPQSTTPAPPYQGGVPTQRDIEEFFAGAHL